MIPFEQVARRPKKIYKIGKYRSSDVELWDLLKGWLGISLAFAIANSGLNVFRSEFYVVFIFSALTVGAGFIVHELSHKIMAQRYGCWAEFRANDQMLILALMMSLFGFVFAAPGAVMIGGWVDRKRNGKISAMGPLGSFSVAILFLALYVLLPFGQDLFYLGAMINTWLGLFNLIPFGMFDGYKIFMWDPKAYFSLAAIGAGLFITVALLL